MSAAAKERDERAAWLAGLKVGDKLVWCYPDGRPRSVHTIQRETPKHWVIFDDWLVCKRAGITRNIITGVYMQPYRPSTDEALQRQRLAEKRHEERAALLRRVARLSTKRLREIVGAAS